MTRILAFPSTRPPDLLDALGEASPLAITQWVRASVDRAGLFLLLLTVGSLLVRPAELVPALANVPIYEALVICCLAVSLPRVGARLTPAALAANPIAAWVLLLVPAVMLSHLARGSIYDARVSGIEMAKAAILFLLVIAQIDTARRLRGMLLALTGYVFIVAVLAVAQFHGFISLPALASVEQRATDPLTGEASVLRRLCGVGVFNDPNDFSLVLVIAMIVCCYGLVWRRRSRAALVLVLPLLTCAYALMLTHSRGGLVAAVGGAGALLSASIGKRNTLMLAALCAPLIVFATSGRQATVEGDEPASTFQARLELWSESFDLLRADPAFGIGVGRLVEEIGQVSHNSFLHAYAEMGIAGGTAFFGAFHLLLRALWQPRSQDRPSARLSSCVLAVTTAYAAGLLSLSRCYSVPTQLVLAIGTACVLIGSTDGRSLLPTMSLRCVGRVAGAGAIFLAATYLFLRVMLERGPT